MNIDKVKFGLRKITTSQFATIDSVQVKEEVIAMNLSFGFGINEKYKILGCSVRFNFMSNNESFIILDVKCDFEIDNDSWKSFINSEDNTIVFPLSLVTHFGVITVGTARGVLHSKTENSEFNKYFIPTVDVTTSLKSDVIIELERD